MQNQMMQNFVMLVGRVLLAAMMFWSGYGRLMSFASVHNYVADWGVPMWVKPILVVWEIGAGLMLLTGFHTRAAAAALALFCVLSGFLVHLHDGDELQLIDFLKNMALTGGFLYVVACGAGSYSLDAHLQLKKAAATSTA
ncbi:MAG TPA: DoxX family protein [Gammaproteobacteria bacterium]|jgi:putative oxidoreductase